MNIEIPTISVLLLWHTAHEGSTILLCSALLSCWSRASLQISDTQPEAGKKIQIHSFARVVSYDLQDEPCVQINHKYEYELSICVTLLQLLQQNLEANFYSGKVSWDEVSPNDAAALLKKFIRELPAPLLTAEYLNTFSAVRGQWTAPWTLLFSLQRFAMWWAPAAVAPIPECRFYDWIPVEIFWCHAAQATKQRELSAVLHHIYTPSIF